MTTTPVAWGGLSRTRDFRLLWIGETTSMLGSSVAGVALPLVAVVSLHASPLAVGLLTAAAWLPWLLVGLPAGATPSSGAANRRHGSPVPGWRGCSRNGSARSAVCWPTRSVSRSPCCACVRWARETRRERAAKRRLRAEIGDGLRFVVHDPYLRALTVFSAVSNIALMGYASIQVVFLTRDLHAGAGQVGLVLALASSGGLFGAALAGRVATRFGTARGFLLCEAVAAPMALLGPIGSGGVGLALFAAAGFGTGLGIVASNILTSTFRQRYCPAELFGRITASTSALNYGAVPLGGLLGGMLGDAVGVRETLMLMAVGQLFSVAILLLGPFRPLRDFPSTR
ncbi:MFS transporter [Microbispora sp. NPDC049633]|uniref:MFS transporter n=1 Tax=Microbispora sp. NPDC049633 TaxID=3154355 RepID=UPI0034146BD2